MQILETSVEWIIDDWAGITIVFSVLAAAVCMVYGIVDNKMTGVVLSFCLIAVTLIIGILVACGVGRHPRNKYTVMLDDNVSINEFYPKYEIVSREPYLNIYHIVERQDGDADN